MERLLQVLQIAGQIGGLFALLVAPYLYFENRKLRRLAARKNRKIAEAKLEQLERNEEAAFEEKMNSLPAAYGIPFEMEGHDIAETKQEVNAAVRRRENYFDEARKLKAEIEEQKEIEKMSTPRGLFGLRSKDDEAASLLILKPLKPTLIKRICGKLKIFQKCR